METKKFISTLKGYKTRFTNKPNADLEKKMVEGLVEKAGGKLEAIAILNESNLEDLKNYMKGVLGVVQVSAEPKKVGCVVSNGGDGEIAMVEGKLYKVDTVKKTLKRVYRDLKDIKFSDVDTSVMPMTVYRNYLKDNFPGEDAPIKKGKLHFRGYRISCNIENGFIIEDTTKKYEVVETPWEGIPTPKELGEFFKKPVVVHTPEEEREAVERGKEFLRRRKEEREAKAAEHERMMQEPTMEDYEKMRKQVLHKIKDIREKIDPKFDPEQFPNMINFKRWRRQANSLLTKWKKKEIRYAKFLKELERITTEETFVIEEKRHRSKFVGTILPAHEKVGLLVGDKIEVDGKWIDAVPFLLEYLLFHEKRAMSQIMKYAMGQITDVELIQNPIDVDWKIEYKKKALENTSHNARVLSMVYNQVGLVAPQDLLYEADVEVGDKILLDVDGELKTRTIASKTKGITLGREVGLLKLDKWIKLPKK